MRRLAIAALALLGLLGGASASAQAPGGATRPADEAFVVLGLMIVDGAPGLAWMLEPRLTQNRPLAVRPGESIGPYQVSRILDDRVELTGPRGPLWVPLLTTGGAAVASAGPLGPSRERPTPIPAARPAAAAESPRHVTGRNPGESVESLAQRIRAAARQRAEDAAAQRPAGPSPVAAVPMSSMPTASPLLAAPGAPTSPAAATPPPSAASPADAQPAPAMPSGGPRVSFPPQGSLMDFLKPQ